MTMRQRKAKLDQLRKGGIIHDNLLELRKCDPDRLPVIKSSYFPDFAICPTVYTEMRATANHSIATVWAVIEGRK